VPEGDTVYRAARLLDRHLSGRPLVATDFRVPQHATTDLAGGAVVTTVSRGKHLLTRITHGADAWTLHTHLKMEGAWRVLDPGRRWPRPAHQARVVLTTADKQAIGFSLGIVELLPTSEEHTVVGHLGPDLLDPGWSEEHEAEALRRLRADPGRPLVEALLDQRNLAGIGNMYAAELCYVAGVHPLAPVGSVPGLTRLVRRARQMLDLNKERPVQTTTGDLRERERMWVYRRDRSACRRCGTPITVAMRPTEHAASRERATYWCPRCQPTLATTPASG
jgi:endonuclease VIII